MKNFNRILKVMKSPRAQVETKQKVINLKQITIHLEKNKNLVLTK